MPENSAFSAIIIDNHSVNIHETPTIRRKTFGKEIRIDQTIAAFQRRTVPEHSQYAAIVRGV